MHAFLPTFPAVSTAKANVDMNMIGKEGDINMSWLVI